MKDILLWAAIYTGTMLLGYALKKAGIFRTGDRAVLANLVLYITLPAMLISSFGGIRVDFWFFTALLLGIVVNLTMLALAAAVSRGKPPELQALYMINGSGFNLGNITMPFLNHFYPNSIPYLCMFDAGDSFFSLGTTYSLACARIGRQGSSSPSCILRSLVRSVPFDVYLLMTLFSLLGLRLPGPVLDAAGFLGQANGCIVMLMVGISFEWNPDPREIREVLTILTLRYSSALILALLFYRVLPAPLPLRQGLSVAVFSAVPNICLIYSNHILPDSTIASTLNPLSMVLAIPTMSLVMLIL